MGFHWHLAPYIAGKGVGWDQLEERLGFKVPTNLKGVVPPVDLSLSVLADLCQALACQPGDLLEYRAQLSPTAVMARPHPELVEGWPGHPDQHIHAKITWVARSRGP